MYLGARRNTTKVCLASIRHLRSNGTSSYTVILHSFPNLHLMTPTIRIKPPAMRSRTRTALSIFLLCLLNLFVPPLAVYLASEDLREVLITLLLWILFPLIGVLCMEIPAGAVLLGYANPAPQMASSSSSAPSGDGGRASVVRRMGHWTRERVRKAIRIPRRRRADHQHEPASTSHRGEYGITLPSAWASQPRRRLRATRFGLRRPKPQASPYTWQVNDRTTSIPSRDSSRHSRRPSKRLIKQCT